MTQTRTQPDPSHLATAESTSRRSGNKTKEQQRKKQILRKQLHHIIYEGDTKKSREDFSAVGGQKNAQVEGKKGEKRVRKKII